MQARVLGTVFKVLGITMVLMLLITILFTVTDAMISVNKLNAVVDSMKVSISEQNALTKEAEETYDNMFKKIEDQSNVISNIVVDKSTITEKHIKNYGEMHTLRISYVVHPFDIALGNATVKGMFVKKTGLQYTVNIEVPIPCIRYLK